MLKELPQACLGSCVDAAEPFSGAAWMRLNHSLFNQALLDGELFGCSQSSTVTVIAAKTVNVGYSSLARQSEG